MPNSTPLYRLQPLNPHAHLFEVTLSIPEPEQWQVLSLPAWIPGSYMIRDFARNIVQLSAHCGGQPVQVHKLDKQTWRLGRCHGKLEVRYQIYAWELSVRAAHLDANHAYANGTSVFLRVHGQDARPCRVELLPPEGADYRDWQVATSLSRDGAPELGFGGYRAEDYAELIDHPLEMGRFAYHRFQVEGIPHAIALTGRQYADHERLLGDLEKLCSYHIRFFADTPPMPEYLFLLTVVDDGYGGLEHRNSCSLLCSRRDLPQRGDAGINENYRNLLGLCSHEYFHAWNVKRIQPAVLQSTDLSREVHTPLLWAFEGITSYYDDLALVRCGLIDANGYLELLGQTITRVLRGSGRFKQSVSESSFDAWTRFYKQDENAPNAIVSYYAKGSLIALALDLKIRLGTEGARSLDDVMRALWQRYGKPGIGIEEAELEAVIGEVSGIDLAGFLEQALRQTDDLPLAELLAQFGIDYTTRPAAGEEDKGGKPAEAATLPPVALGLRGGNDPLGVKVLNVFDGGAAQTAGVAAGDILVAVDGLRCTAANLGQLLKVFQPGEQLTLHAFRRDELQVFELILQAPPADTCYLNVQAQMDMTRRARLCAWLGEDAAT